GIPDLALKASPLYANSPTGNFMQVLQGNGDGTFAVTGRQYVLANTSDPVLGADFNGDGATDLVELSGALSSFHTIPAAPAPAISIAVDSGPLVANNGSATVSLALPAASDLDVVLAASDAHVQLPTTVHFAAGEQDQSFSFTLQSGFDSGHVLRLAATLSGTTAETYVAVANPNVPTGVKATWSPDAVQSVTPGESVHGDLVLSSVGGYAGTYTGFQCGG